MKTIRFNTIIGEDHVIHPPPSVELDAGAAEVIVVQDVKPAQPTATPRRPLRERLAAAAAELGISHLPADLAENHDQYAHGAAKGVDCP
jgi:hypothetical protein